jgi:hypothetical protein
MGVMVARFAGANDPHKVNRVVYQAFLTAAGLSVILGTIGWFLSPSLLDLINAAPAVKAEALPFLRTMLAGILGMMMFFMLSGAFRSAGDSRTPLRLGILMTALTVVFNVLLIPRFGTIGAAFGTVASSTIVSAFGVFRMTRPDSVIHFEPGMSTAPDFAIIRSLFRFGLPTGFQGIAMNIAGVLLLRYIGSLPESAAAQAAYAVCYTELFSLITWTSVGLMGASATIAGQNLGAGHPDRVVSGVWVASRIGVTLAAGVGGTVPGRTGAAARRLRHDGSCRARHRPAIAAVPGDLRLLRVGGVVFYGGAPGHRRHAQSAVYFHRVADRHSARLLRDHAGDARAPGVAHLDGDCARAHDAVHPEHRAVPAAEVADDYGGIDALTRSK